MRVAHSALWRRRKIFNRTKNLSLIQLVNPVFCGRSDQIYDLLVMSGQNIWLRPPWECWQAARDSWTPGGWREGEVRLHWDCLICEVWCKFQSRTRELEMWKYSTTTCWQTNCWYVCPIDTLHTTGHRLFLLVWKLLKQVASMTRFKVVCCIVVCSNQETQIPPNQSNILISSSDPTHNGVEYWTKYISKMNKNHFEI